LKLRATSPWPATPRRLEAQRHPALPRRLDKAEDRIPPRARHLDVVRLQRKADPLLQVPPVHRERDPPQAPVAPQVVVGVGVGRHLDARERGRGGAAGCRLGAAAGADGMRCAGRPAAARASSGHGVSSSG
jgi:hypothetical protein